jgi:D-sedoheptulose 7-phosphate isomerase
MMHQTTDQTTGQTSPPAPCRERDAHALFGRRVAPAEALARDAEDVARACHAMAVRFHRGGTLYAFGSGSAATDAQHISVEFVHPVIVGKRALPAVSLTSDIATVTGAADQLGPGRVFAHQLCHLARPQDIALGVTAGGAADRTAGEVVGGLCAARALGLLTVALVGTGWLLAGGPPVDHVLRARSDDPRVVKEIHVTTYHVLWELVHLFLEQPGLLAEEATGT